MKNGKNVLSLFNGMSTAHQAFKNMGIEINNYYSSEIKKAALELTKFHFPETIELGNILHWRAWDIDWKSIDIVLSGSPCKDLSIAGKRKGINGSNSGLFWVFIDILNHIKKLNPDVLFLQENVGSAQKKDIGIMSRALGVYPVRINSKLVTAQLRSRFYWCNFKTKQDGIFGDLITDIPQPKDMEVTFKSILENGYTNRYKSTALTERQSNSASYKNPNSKKAQKYYESRDRIGMLPIVYIEKGKVKVKTNTKKGFEILTETDCLNLAFESSTTRRGRVTRGKSPCLLEGNEPLYSLKDFTIRLLTKTERCRLQGFPDDYCNIISTNQAASLLGDGWTLPVIEHIFRFLPFYKTNKL